MTEHQERADRLEREADRMQQRSEELGEDIAAARDDWERKRREETVPGAPAPEQGLPPEANYPASGDEPPQDGDADSAREPWPDE